METFLGLLNLACWIGGSILVGSGTNWKVGLGTFILAFFLKGREA